MSGPLLAPSDPPLTLCISFLLLWGPRAGWSLAGREATSGVSGGPPGPGRSPRAGWGEARMV